ncbi:SoxR reducing system RseC family protein [Peptoniphilus sp. oral taxon 386]|uniref:SoxR reducing system RseC family protein n=1 Tax=Peptoniphilus sp. oral taxon 386 TaxID=652713 RepID=UPI0001DA9CDA|nr:SoxR reducing system RseC family protein [Peptoniphilus sp. oral taxon 386]EFI42254.1 positive regulator of sigma(E), RseC/MucC [Peptoniphilus sp. oral taxon 386 str. F0131]
MEQMGVVVKELGEFVEIHSFRQAACGSSCESCHAKCAESKLYVLKAKNTLGLKVGDKVKIETNSKNVIKYILLVYGLPLIFFLFGILISYNIFNKYSIDNAQILSFIIAVLTTGLAFYIIKKIDVKYGNNKLDVIVLKRC